MSETKLAQLRSMTSVVADTGDIDAIRQHQPDDATTNPSLILKAVTLPAYESFVADAVAHLKQTGREVNPSTVADDLSVRIGREISKVVSGYVSTEVDARLSFDTDATYAKAKQIIALYEELDVPRSRILIKIASTWEGIRAAERLEKEGIRCNLTLLFSFAQAVACAEAGAFLISPFVGRIYDWYCNDRGVKHIEPEEDPGVLSVRRIYQYYKDHGYPTIVMGASFRNTGQIEALAGCDKLTISPDLLEKLESDATTLEQRLNATTSQPQGRPAPMTEAAFRWQHNEDAMATEKLAEGIRKFADDQVKLEKLLEERISRL